MKNSPEKISPLRRRMIEDMRMRKLSTKRLSFDSSQFGMLDESTGDFFAEGQN